MVSHLAMISHFSTVAHSSMASHLAPTKRGIPLSKGIPVSMCPQQRHRHVSAGRRARGHGRGTAGTRGACAAGRNGRGRPRQRRHVVRAPPAASPRRPAQGRTYPRTLQPLRPSARSFAGHSEYSEYGVLRVLGLVSTRPQHRSLGRAHVKLEPPVPNALFLRCARAACNGRCVRACVS